MIEQAGLLAQFCSHVQETMVRLLKPEQNTDD